MASREQHPVGLSVEECIINLGVCSTKLKVYLTTLGIDDIIIGMDWLEAHRAFVDCYAKRMLCINDEGTMIQIQGIKRKVSLCFISLKKVKHCMKQCCQLYVVEEVSEEKGPSLEQYPVLQEFKVVFPKKLPGLPPKRELDFTIELKPNVEPIFNTPYRMATLEL